ncbi:conserved exported protein of unknown function [Tenacibaculum sp. 190130A14a]|uniref:Lipocalin-like domain-containing protein n=1 Tax=Tenacibaculum polynesiense TaxID=3137857 RepID=A0ABP1F5I6_9FLAO
MKKVLTLLFIATVFLSCSSNNNDLIQEESLVGRWHLVGFEKTVLYEFTNDLRHTIYSTDGNFGSLSDAIPNPNPWTYDGKELTIDLHFGNSLKASLDFKCNNNVVHLIASSGTTILYREGYNYKNCTE